jgi:hypothetical protein
VPTGPIQVDQFVFEIGITQRPPVQVDQFVFEIGIVPQPPVISCGNPPQGNVGTLYSQTFPVQGGTVPYTFAITAGSLPPGLTLNTASGTASGTPTTQGTFPFTVQVTTADSLSSSVACSITINASLTTPVSIVGGGPPALQCAKEPNCYDWCTEDLIRRTRRIDFPPLCTMPRQYRFRGREPWADESDGSSPLPYQGVPFNVYGAILTPAAAQGDVLVVQAQVPLGYDAILTSIYQIYQGSGFQQGSGDIIWRIRRNQYWLKNLGNEAYALGNPKNPVDLTEGELIYSGQTFGYYVNAPNVSGMIQVGAGRIAVGMLGFYWPRG